MKLTRMILVLCCFALLTSSFVTAGTSRSNSAILNAAEPAANGSWYFAVSGDSRDCGDLIMPRIAKAIADHRQDKPVAFYWHLGDLRAIYRVDCDIAKRDNPQTKCAMEALPNEKVLVKNDKYVNLAWQDYKDSQIKPFQQSNIDFVLGIGNHELIAPKSRKLFRDAFKDWLRQPLLHNQWELDHQRGIDSDEGSTYFHFVRNGVDLIYLDNANIYNEDPQDKQRKDPGFSGEQLHWLDQILTADQADKSIKAVIVGMHAALPESVSKSHAMDRSCESFCSGKRAYAMIERFKAGGKNVLVLASHSHYVEPNAYATPELKGHVLPGWIIGTAGAEQYRLKIKYGYLLVEVKPNGTLRPSFREVKRDSPTLATQHEPAELTNYCFAMNKKLPDPNEKFVTAKDCSCSK